MTVIQQEGYTLFQPVSDYNRSNYDLKAIDLVSKGSFLGTFHIKAYDGQILRKQIRKFDTCLILNKITGERVDVIRISEPFRILGATLFTQPWMVPSSSPPLSSLPSPPLNPLTDLSGNLVQHVTMPSVAKKPTVKPASLLPPIIHKKQSTVTDTLSPFVAKQLLELAQLKHEMCPIIAEEFTAGNSAIMPCGHMFSQIAIKESFKKELGKCPACRQSGTPTYI